MDDLISRRAAIDAMTNTLWHYPNECYRNLNEYESAKGLAELGLKSVPSVQPERRWIPCSERLPENDERVLATNAWGEVTIAERIYPPIDDTCWFIHDGNTNATIDDVVAWMSLPEPYRGEQDG